MASAVVSTQWALWHTTLTAENEELEATRCECHVSDVACAAHRRRGAGGRLFDDPLVDFEDEHPLRRTRRVSAGVAPTGKHKGPEAHASMFVHL